MNQRVIPLFALLSTACAASSGPPVVKMPSAVANPTQDTVVAPRVTVDYHPIFFSPGKGQRGYVIGGSTEGRFVRAANFAMNGKYTTIEQLKSEVCRAEPQDFTNWVDLEWVRGGELYQLFSCSQGRCSALTSVTGGKAVLSLQGSDDSLKLVIQTEAFAPPVSGFVVGVAGRFNAPSGSTATATSPDFDGDGQLDALAVGGDKPAGVQFLAETGKGSASVSVRLKQRTYEVFQLELDSVYTSVWDYGLLDLNGDGKPEVVSYTAGHNVSLGVYELGKSAAVQVLDWYAGD